MLKNRLLIKMLPIAALAVIIGSASIGCTDAEDPTPTSTQPATTTSQPPATTTQPGVPGEAVYEGMYVYDDFKSRKPVEYATRRFSTAANLDGPVICARNGMMLNISNSPCSRF